MGHRADYRVVLVHTASGGIGQAALQMLHLQGSSVMATAGSSMKRTLVRQHGAKVACSSRDLWFGEAALTGAGPSPETGLSSPDSHIGLVINSLTSPGTLGASLGACGPGACFVELSKRSIWSHSRVAQDRHDVLYNIVALDLMHPASVGGILSRISALAASGHIEGLQTNLFTFNSLPPALRSMSSGGHTGKVVCYNPDPPKTPARNWHISGGLGALGALAAAWLANGGASSLVLLGRTGCILLLGCCLGFSCLFHSLSQHRILFRPRLTRSLRFSFCLCYYPSMLRSFCIFGCFSCSYSCFLLCLFCSSCDSRLHLDLLRCSCGSLFGCLSNGHLL